jgi:hypothetical protein
MHQFGFESASLHAQQLIGAARDFLCALVSIARITKQKEQRLALICCGVSFEHFLGVSYVSYLPLNALSTACSAIAQSFA